jgi:hypothetical protein
MDLGDLSTRWANVFHFEDGRVTQIACYFDARQALADLGLTPEPGTGNPHIEVADYGTSALYAPGRHRPAVV